MSEILDKHAEVYDLVLADLADGGIDVERGREGLSAEQVLRAAIIKQSNGFSYELLAFHLADSMCYRAFCRIGLEQKLDAGTLQRNVKKIRAATFEAINRIVIGEAKERGVEQGRMVRTDCTVEETNIHEPSDSSLLFDVVRVLARLMRQGKEASYDIEFVDHTRGAKRRMLGIQNAKNKHERTKLYRRLVKLCSETIDDALRAIVSLDDVPTSFDPMAIVVGYKLTVELEHFIGLGRKVLLQTKRRVFWQEKVEASEKLVSIFEPHTDIIKKDRRETLFGHKLCLTTGKSGLILDCIVLKGNPADSTLVVRSIERQKEIFGRVPRQASFDGGFASESNRKAAKKLGVKDVAFHKKRGMDILKMAKSTWVYKKLRRFRAGIEGGISFLKRCFGLSRCAWSSRESFEAYTWASVLSANLLMLSRHALAQES